MRAQSITAPCPVLPPATASRAVREIVRDRLRHSYPTPPNSLASRPFLFFGLTGTFSKLKTALRKGAARTVKALMKLIGKLLKTFAPKQCANYFRHAGYAA